MSDKLELRILLVTGIFPPDVGGPATYIPHLAQSLVARGHKVQVVTLSGSDTTSNVDRGRPYAVTRIKRGEGRFAWRLRLLPRLRRSMRWADVVLANGVFGATSLASVGLKVPVIMKVVGDHAWERAVNWGWTSEHMDGFQDESQSSRIRLLKALRNLSLKGADRVIVPSQYLSDVVEGWGLPDKSIEVVYNAVEIPEQLPDPPVAPGQGLTLITVARLVPWKRLGLVLRILTNLEGAEYIVVGDGPMKERWKALAHELEVDDRVRFLGRLPHEQTLAQVKVSDVFVLPSAYEGLPHVILEALALDIPVVASRAGGIPEVVEDGVTGWMADTEGKITKILDSLCSDGRYRRMPRASENEKTVERFKWRLMVDQTISILQAEINRKSQHGT